MTQAAQSSPDEALESERDALVAELIGLGVTPEDLMEAVGSSVEQTADGPTRERTRQMRMRIERADAARHAIETGLYANNSTFGRIRQEYERISREAAERDAVAAVAAAQPGISFQYAPPSTERIRGIRSDAIVLDEVAEISQADMEALRAGFSAATATRNLIAIPDADIQFVDINARVTTARETARKAAVRAAFQAAFMTVANLWGGDLQFEAGEAGDEILGAFRIEFPDGQVYTSSLVAGGTSARPAEPAPHRVVDLGEAP